MMDPDKINEETRSMIGEVYRVLVRPNNTTIELFKLESILSRLIVQAEYSMLTARRREEWQIAERFLERKQFLKRLADGLVWKWFDLSETKLRTYAKGASPGLMAGKLGYGLERQLVQLLQEMSRYQYKSDDTSYPKIKHVIQNDITNILRIGDVTIVFDTGDAYFFEVKKRTNSRQARSQKWRAASLNEYLAKGSSESLEEWLGPYPLKSMEVNNIVPAFYWKELERIAGKALKDGIAMKALDPGLSLIGIRSDMYESPSTEGAMTQLLLGIAGDGDPITYGCLSRHFASLDKEHNEVMRVVRPITAFDIDPSVGLAIMFGDIEIVLVVNYQTIVDELNNAGYRASFSEGRVSIEVLGATTTLLERVWSFLIYELPTLQHYLDYVGESIIEISRWISAQE